MSKNYPRPRNYGKGAKHPSMCGYPLKQLHMYLNYVGQVNSTDHPIHTPTIRGAITLFSANKIKILTYWCHISYK